MYKNAENTPTVLCVLKAVLAFANDQIHKPELLLTHVIVENHSLSKHC